MKMKLSAKTALVIMICFTFCWAVTVYRSPVASAAASEALRNVSAAKAVFDVRVGEPTSAMNHLKLIHSTYKELLTAGKKPRFVVVFIGPSVKLISKDTKGFAPADQETLGVIASIVSNMSKDGITMEICMVAAKSFHVDAASVLPEIMQVPNGWISLIGYQDQGYSLVPAY